VDILEGTAREAYIIEQRTQRVPFRTIGDNLGISAQRVHQIFEAARDRIPAARLADLRAEEAELADRAIADLLRRINTLSDEKAHGAAELWNSVRGWSESKRKLFGADAPQRKEITVLTEDAVDAAIRKVNEEHAALAAQAKAAGMDMTEWLETA
jgi:2,4-dienoyl-CoA reductase-like NADH-dependent reductase (Old Yellow Enzyme family)